MIRSMALRAARTFLQTFLALISAAPLLELNVSSVKAAAVGGVSAVLAAAQRALDETPVSPIPPG